MREASYHSSQGISLKQPKLGSGERFKKLKNKLSKEKGVKDTGALAASIGRKKYGNKKFNELSKKGKS